MGAGTGGSKQKTVAPRSRKNRPFNNTAFYRALDAARIARGLNWKDIAEQTGISASTLTRIGQGSRPDVDSLAALCAWADLDPNQFIRTRKNHQRTEPLAVISSAVHDDPNLSRANADLLDQLIKTTYTQLRRA